MDDCQIIVAEAGRWIRTRSISGLAPQPGRRAFHRPLPGRRGSDAQSRPVGDDVKPGAECFTDPKGGRFSDQDQERRLKRILGVVRIADHRPTDAPDHRRMPLDQRSQDELGTRVVPVLVGRLESVEELPVR